jgi:hypothetical protein
MELPGWFDGDCHGALLSGALTRSLDELDAALGRAGGVEGQRLQVELAARPVRAEDTTHQHHRRRETSSPLGRITSSEDRSSSHRLARQHRLAVLQNECTTMDRSRTPLPKQKACQKYTRSKTIHPTQPPPTHLVWASLARFRGCRPSTSCQESTATVSEHASWDASAPTPSGGWLTAPTFRHAAPSRLWRQVVVPYPPSRGGCGRAQQTNTLLC